MELIKGDAFRADEATAEHMIPVTTNLLDLVAAHMDFQSTCGLAERAGPILDSHVGFGQEDFLLAPWMLRNHVDHRGDPLGLRKWEVYHSSRGDLGAGKDPDSGREKDIQAFRVAWILDSRLIEKKGGAMKDFKGKTAVVTGAASGIGRSLARQCAAEGMKLVLADIDESGMDDLMRELRDQGTSVEKCITDVRDFDSVERLVAFSRETYGSIHLVFNNAGVMLGGYAWERSEDDWRWVFDVNFFGVVNGLRAFMPVLLEQGEEAHVVNTASIGGLMVGPFLSPYIVSKHAVVALTESVYYELQTLGTQVGISALCPGAVSTGIVDSERIRPEDRSQKAPLGSQLEREFDHMLTEGVKDGIDPEEVGPMVFSALREKRFWIYTHPMMEESILPRARSIIDGTNPLYAPELTENLLTEE